LAMAKRQALNTLRPPGKTGSSWGTASAGRSVVTSVHPEGKNRRWPRIEQALLMSLGTCRSPRIKHTCRFPSDLTGTAHDLASESSCMAPTGSVHSAGRDDALAPTPVARPPPRSPPPRGPQDQCHLAAAGASERAPAREIVEIVILEMSTGQLPMPWSRRAHRRRMSRAQWQKCF
jgi:hypothetical protein